MWGWSLLVSLESERFFVSIPHSNQMSLSLNETVWRWIIWPSQVVVVCSPVLTHHLDKLIMWSRATTRQQRDRWPALVYSSYYNPICMTNIFLSHSSLFYSQTVNSMFVNLPRSLCLLLSLYLFLDLALYLYLSQSEVWRDQSSITSLLPGCWEHLVDILW